jgi:uncharacterized membrane protein
MVSLAGDDDVGEVTVDLDDPLDDPGDDPADDGDGSPALAVIPGVQPGASAVLVETPPSAGRVSQERSTASPSGLRGMLKRPGVIDALLSGVGFGLFFVFIARTSPAAGHWPLVSARMVSAVMFAGGAILTSGAVLPHKESRRGVVLAGLLDAAAAAFFVLSTRNGLLSVGAVLASLYPAATIVLARFITKERITRNQLVGLALAGAAVSLLAI